MSDQSGTITVIDDVPFETYKTKQITTDVMNMILNKSPFLEASDVFRGTVVGVREHVARESEFVLKTCELKIMLDNPGGGINNRVKCIVIRSGKCKNKIHCSRNSDGNISVVYTQMSNRLKAKRMLRAGWDAFKGILALGLHIIVSHDAMLGFRSHNNMLTPKQSDQQD